MSGRVYNNRRLFLQRMVESNLDRTPAERIRFFNTLSKPDRFELELMLKAHKRKKRNATT